MSRTLYAVMMTVGCGLAAAALRWPALGVSPGFLVVGGITLGSAATARALLGRR
jgi:hypothetical protein